MDYTQMDRKVNGTKLNKNGRKRTSLNLTKLKEQIKEDINLKDIDNNLLLATWNIRDLGANGPKHGGRNMEDLYYIAEIISAFDFVAVQEVNELEEWEIIMDLLGRNWSYIATDISDYADGGNGERMTFVWDTRKVWFKNIAGEVVLSRTNLISEAITVPKKDKKFNPTKRQFARTPFLVSFQSGWLKFDVCTVHIYYGSESGQKLKRRIKEIDTIAKEISRRAEKALDQWKTMILLGDFNIVHPDHQTMEKLMKYDFIIPESIKNPSNINKDKYYDQIAFKTKDYHIQNRIEQEDKWVGGVFDIFKSIMNEDDVSSYKKRMQNCDDGSKCNIPADYNKYFRTWKTHHLSDHNVMWVRIPIDFSERALKHIAK